jgi:hypothetical protein
VKTNATMWTFIVLSGSLSSLCAECSQIKTGVSIENLHGLQAVVATARKPWPSGDVDGQSFALRDATMAAKGNLAKFVRRTKLDGILVRSWCASRGHVYVTVEVSQPSQGASGRLSGRVAESIRKVPTPQ